MYKKIIPIEGSLNDFIIVHLDEKCTKKDAEHLEIAPHKKSVSGFTFYEHGYDGVVKTKFINAEMIEKLYDEIQLAKSAPIEFKEVIIDDLPF